MAQFYTKERSVSGASPKIFDDTQRVIKESEELIERMRAVSAYEEQQQAALVNNLRAQRQRDKELNTRNHKMLMDNMRQVAEVTIDSEIEKARQDDLKAKERAEQEQRTMQALSSLSKSAGQFAGAAIEDAEQKAQARLAEITEDKELIAPALFDTRGIGTNAQLNEEENNFYARSAGAKLAKILGEERGTWSKIWLSEDRISRLAHQHATKNLADKIENGGFLEDVWRNTEGSLTYTDPYTGEQVTRTHQDIIKNSFRSSEELNRAYTAQAKKMLDQVKGSTKGTGLHLEANTKVRNYINSRAHAFSSQITRNLERKQEAAALEEIMSADTPKDRAELAAKFIDTAITHPLKDRATAQNQVLTQVLANDKNPLAFADAFDKTPAPHLGKGKTMKGSPIAELIRKDAELLQIAKDKELLATRVEKGTRAAKLVAEAARSDNGFIDLQEKENAYRSNEDKYFHGAISYEQFKAFNDELDKNYVDSNESKAVVSKLQLLQQQQDPSLIAEARQAFASGHINAETKDEFVSFAEELAEVKLPNGLQYSQKSIHAQALHIASDKVTRFDVSGQAKNFTARAAADIAADMYLQKYEKYLDELTPGAAAKQAWADVQAAMLDETGVFFVDRTDSQRGNVYSRLSTGTHTGAMEGTAAPLMSASEFGQSLRGNGLSQLDADVSMDIDRNLAVYAARSNSGLRPKFTQYDQEAADAAGISATEMFNRRFKALGIDAEIKEDPIDILRKQNASNPELMRVLNSPKTWNKESSVVDRTPNVYPRYMGTGSLSYQNARSIADKLNNPNPEAIAAAWYLKTNGGNISSDLSPMQQIQQVIEENPGFNMYFNYAELANANPALVTVMQQYGDSHNFISGTSKTIARLSNSMGPQDMQTGFKYMQHQLGFTRQGAAYLVGNIQQESSWNGTRSWGEVLNDGSQKNSGLVSWAEFKGNRRRVKQIEDYLGKPIEKASHTEQLNAIKWELETYYPNEYKVFTDPNASDQQLKSASEKYLRYAHEGDRFEFAKQLLNQ